MANIDILCRFIIRYYETNKDTPPTNLELQKVLYYLQAYHLAVFKAPLFDEEPEAWIRGPVFKSVYDKFKSYGSNTISLNLEYGESIEEEYNSTLAMLSFTEEEFSFISQALTYFTSKTIGQLISRSHTEKPWLDARKGLTPLGYSTEKITFKSMQDFYSELIEKRNDGSK